MHTHKSLFKRDTRFDTQFEKKAPGVRWYPFVGSRFAENSTRIIVFAHNIPVPADSYKEKMLDWADKTAWADADTIYDYTYNYTGDAKNYTKAFKSFIRGAVGLQSRYDVTSDPAVVSKIDSFITRIAYVNFIQDAVIKKTNCQMVRATPEQEQLSITINRGLLRVLAITHCICWGKNTYEYVRRSMEGYPITSENHDLGRSGFSSRTFDLGQGKLMHCLRVFHPSMPGFGSTSKVTHSIISGFLAKPSFPVPITPPSASSASSSGPSSPADI